ncbi:hypothetical protein IGI04_031056 [Brassica rapa subsp. trilocularis]|uniref:Uncharacterized protein n=1 Tax=Brassica rapa subsp. trilocularis TaxID=1813537 RepID=A0ABQ7LV86_BRACM|nr:hypothetical protein IGI04_031056 [Brassica rapa subsp. trilocularis]
MKSKRSQKLGGTITTCVSYSMIQEPATNGLKRMMETTLMEILKRLERSYELITSMLTVVLLDRLSGHMFQLRHACPEEVLLGVNDRQKCEEFSREYLSDAEGSNHCNQEHRAVNWASPCPLAHIHLSINGLKRMMETTLMEILKRLERSYELITSMLTVVLLDRLSGHMFQLRHACPEEVLFGVNDRQKCEEFSREYLSDAEGSNHCNQEHRAVNWASPCPLAHIHLSIHCLWTAK